MMAVVVQNLLQKVLVALKVDDGAKTPCSFAFTKFKSILDEWKCFTSDLAVPFWQIYAPGARQSDIKKLSMGISAENFMLLADLGDASLLVIKIFGKGKGEKPLSSLCESLRIMRRRQMCCRNLISNRMTLWPTLFFRRPKSFWKGLQELFSLTRAYFPITS